MLDQPQKQQLVSAPCSRPSLMGRALQGNMSACIYLWSCSICPDLLGQRVGGGGGIQRENYMKKRQVLGVRCGGGGAVDQGGFSACQAPFVFLRGEEGSCAAVTTLSTWVLQKDAQMFKTVAAHTHRASTHLSPPHTHTHKRLVRTLPT